MAEELTTEATQAVGDVAETVAEAVSEAVTDAVAEARQVTEPVTMTPQGGEQHWQTTTEHGERIARLESESGQLRELIYTTAAETENRVRDLIQDLNPAPTTQPETVEVLVPEDGPEEEPKRKTARKLWLF